MYKENNFDYIFDKKDLYPDSSCPKIWLKSVSILL